MSWDCSLKDKDTGETIHLSTPHYLCGNTYDVEGTTECWLSITYNYGPFFRRVYPEEGIRIIDGKTGREAIPLLLKIANKLDWSGEKGLTAAEARERLAEVWTNRSDEEVLTEWDRKRGDIKGTRWDFTERNALEAVIDLIHLSMAAENGVWAVE